MVAIPVRAESAETLQARLYAESRVEVPVTTHGNHVLVRLSVQAYNTEEDIERLLNAPALL